MTFNKTKGGTFAIETENGARLALFIQPGARKNQIVGVHGTELKIQISAPPVDGKANEALIKWLSVQLNVKKSSIKIVNGLKGRHKILEIFGQNLDDILEKLPLP